MDNKNNKTNTEDIKIAIQGSINIDKIKFFKANRDISQKEVMKKISLFKQFGLLDSIKVFYFEEDKSIYAAEGQHRIEAAKILGIEKVPCVVINWVKKEDTDKIYDIIRMYNNNGYPWTLQHYIKHFADLEYTDYKYVFRKMEEYGDRLSRATVVTSYFGNADSRKKVKAGFGAIESRIFSDNLLNRLCGLISTYGQRIPVRSVNYIAGHIVKWPDNKDLFMVAAFKEIQLALETLDANFPDGAESIGNFFRDYVERSYNNMVDNETK
jgi:hypothetical protein